jgi:hypothetical protein
MKTKIANLRHEIAKGIDQLDKGYYQSYNNTNVMQLADEVSRLGRIRLDALRSTSGIAVKVHGKK